MHARPPALQAGIIFFLTTQDSTSLRPGLSHVRAFGSKDGSEAGLLEKLLRGASKCSALKVKAALFMQHQISVEV
jgi:hypothetical protein